MNQSILVIDNIAELLVKIIRFTRARQKELVRNVNNVYTTGYVPMDLEVEHFSNLLHNAISEHIENQRIVLRDTKNIKFGTNGNFDTIPVVDKEAKNLLQNDPDEYIETQIDKIIENTLNQKIATELLSQKNKTVSIN